METKISIIGEGRKQVKVNKAIIFVHLMSNDGSLKKSGYLPNEWENIILLRKAEEEEIFDIMYAHSDKDPNRGCLYLGYWNDGVV